MSTVTHVSRGTLNKAVSRYEGLKKRFARFQEKGEGTVQKVVRSVEVGTMALGLGIVNGRSGSIEVMGVPLELAIGVALNVGGYFNAAGKHSEHLNNFGDGALACYLATVGKGIGVAMAQKAVGGGSAGQVTAAAKGRSDLSPAEIAAAVANA